MPYQQVYGWEEIGSTSHPVPERVELSERLWKLADELIEQDPRDWQAIGEVQRLALWVSYADTDACTCLPDSDACEVCRKNKRIHELLGGNNE